MEYCGLKDPLGLIANVLKIGPLITTLVFSLMCGPAYATPQDKLAVLGMSVGDVLRTNGAPQEKDELEIKRLEIWRYPQQELVFSKGTVVLVKPIHPLSDKQFAAKGSSKDEARAPALATNKPVDSGVFDSILKEIMEDKGSGGEPVAGTGASALPTPVPPGIMQVSPLGGPPMPGVPGANR